jgi:hypothetical protein
MDAKDVTIRKTTNQQDSTAKQEGIPNIPVAKWNKKIYSNK